MSVAAEPIITEAGQVQAQDLRSHNTPLVRNLENPEVLLQGKPTLEECFAQIDAEAVRKEMEAIQMAPDRVPRNILQIIAAPAFPNTLCGLFKKSLNPKSN